VCTCCRVPQLPGKMSPPPPTTATPGQLLIRGQGQTADAVVCFPKLLQREESENTENTYGGGRGAGEGVWPYPPTLFGQPKNFETIALFQFPRFFALDEE
jgi:hypothetical protein